VKGAQLADARAAVRELGMHGLSIRFRLDFGNASAIGPGKIALLETIARTGSLSQAARELGMSYRRAWLLLDSLNNSFRRPVAELSKGGRGGGGATLTPFGKTLVGAYRKLEVGFQQRARATFATIARDAVRTAGPKSPRRPLGKTSRR
jgi:molybdate transport system regulatory protein